MNQRPAAHKRAAVGVLALCAAWACSSVHAASTSRLVVDRFAISLIDLSSSDGVAPSIRFDGRVDPQGLSLPVIDVSAGAFRSSPSASSGDQDSALTLGSAAASAGLGSTVADSAISGTGAWPGTSAVLSGSTGSPSGALGASASFLASAGVAFAGSTGGFVLSPMTLAQFTLVINAQVQTTGGCLQRRFFLQCDYAGASVGISIDGPGASGAGFQSSGNSRDVAATADMGRVWDPVAGSWTDRYEPVTRTLSGLVLSATFVNLSTDSLRANLSIGASISGGANVTAVPEPSTYGLLLLGLALLRSRRPGRCFRLAAVRRCA